MKRKSRKTIATMTFHLAHNYGAMLQAYALATAVNNLGYRCEVLDYRFPYIDKWSGILTWKDLIQKNNPFLGTAKWFNRILHGFYKNQTPAQRKFNSFMRQQMPLSFTTYFTADQIRKSRFDVVIFGSDQIWNSKLTNGVALEYFGACLDTNKTRLVAYAASCGKSALPEDEKEQLLPLLQRFSAIGIREDEFTRFLRCDYGLEAQTVIDPVLLLTKEEWDRLLRRTPPVVKEPYLLVYAFDVGEDIYNLARRIAAQRGLRLVSVGYSRNEALSDMLQLTDCGPMEFLRLVRNADFVCTSSFHGEAFSIIFQRNFYCVGHPEYSLRNISLLREMRLTDRLVQSENDVVEIIDCCFDEVNALLEEQRTKAKQFLYNAIEG